MQTQVEARKEFQRFIKDKTRENGKKLCIEAYESILTAKRNDERDQL